MRKLIIGGILCLTFSGAAYFLLNFSIFGGCDKRILGKLKTETGHVIEWFELSCNATTSDGTVVTIKRKGWFEEPHCMFDLKGIRPIAVTSSDGKNVSVSYEKGDILYKSEDFDGIRFTFSEF